MQFNNLSVVEFNNIVKNILDSEEMLFNCTVVGEISSYKISNGVAYFTIKDDYAVLSCVLFGADKEYKIGDRVKVVGRPNYYVKGGKLSFNVTYITSFGEGDIYKRFLLLKEKLRAEGFFASKKELPERVEKIGVVTSGKGAVIRDIISVVGRRDPNVSIYVYSAKVQGVGAEREIEKGINFFDNYDVDIVIVARGGGSSEDLAVFNTEEVCRACFKCSKPLISAVGHETDYTLIDLVADIRASTPSVAAELAVKESKDNLIELKLRQNRLENQVLRRFEEFDRKLENSFNAISNNIKVTFDKQANALINFKKSLSLLIKDRINKFSYHLEKLDYKIKALDPKMILNKGYAKVEKDNKHVKSVKNLTKDDNLIINLKDGKVLVKVLGVKDEI